MNETNARAEVSGHRNIVVQAIGSGVNVTIDPRLPYLRLTDFEERTNRASDGSDAALLSAYRTDVVPLFGREHVLEDLRLWLALDRGVSVRVMTGGAGRGKTRLALELVRDAARKGWVAGFVERRELDRFRAQQNAAEWGWDKPVLIVIDYAASRAHQLRDWIGELVDTPAVQPPLRLLLVERHAQRDGWPETVFGRGQNDRSRAAASLLDPSEPVELAAIEELPLRRQIFATLLTLKRADLVPPEIGTAPEFDRLLLQEKWSGDPLFLMMAGLVAGTRGINDALALTRTDLATTMARRELDRIGDIAAGAGINDPRPPGFLARHAAVLVTLCQGLTLPGVRTLIEDEAPRLKLCADINSTVAALRDALPGTGDGSEIAPIMPDIVGEAAIMCWLGDGGELSRLGSDPLDCVHRAATATLEHAGQVLVRTAQDFAADGRNEAVQWLRAVAQAREADLDALVTIVDAIPHGTGALQKLAADLAQTVVHRLRDNGSDRQTTEALGGRLNNLCVRQSDLGCRDAALAASQEAVAIYRRLAAARPDAFLPDLARSLSNVALCLSGLGRHEEALATYRDALVILQGLTETRLDVLHLDLAKILDNVGGVLSNLSHRKEDALAAIQEVVEIQSRLAKTPPDKFLPGLAESLGNLSARLSDLAVIDKVI